MTRFLSKTVIVLLAVAILVPAPLYVTRVHAAWPVVNTIDIPRVAEAILRRAAITAGKVAIQSMTRSIVNWINSGFNGSPAFERNLGVSLRRLGDAAAADFVTELATNASINSPWVDRIAGTVATGYLLYTSRDRLAARLEYTLNEYVTDAVAWERGDFRQGGFNAWMSSTFRCGNDPYCAEFVAQEELINRIDGMLRNAIEVRGWGRGFLSWPCPGQEPGGQGTSLSDADTSGDQDTCTPGSTIETAMGITATSPLRQLEVAESIDQIIGALASQMVSQVFSGGGLFGNSGDGGSDASRDQLSQTTLLSTLSANFIEVAQNDRTNVITYRDAWTRIRDVASTAKCAAGTPGALEASALIAQATTAIAKAGRALDALGSIITRAESARAGSTNTLATNVTADYNCLISGGFPNAGACTQSNVVAIGTECPVSSSVLPRGTELACVVAQAQNVEDTVPPTLLMRMNERADGNCN